MSNPGEDITNESISYFPGEPFGKDASGNIVPSPGSNEQKESKEQPEDKPSEMPEEKTVEKPQGDTQLPDHPDNVVDVQTFRM